MRFGLMLAIIAVAGGPVSAKGLASPDKLLAGRTPGKPVQCIDQNRIVDTQTFDDGSIYYRMSASSDYLQRPHDCSQLNSNMAYSTQAPSTQLCRGDILKIFDPAAHISYGSCIFDSFVPYSRAKTSK